MRADVAIFGAGAWGTALAVHLAPRMRVRAVDARDAHSATSSRARARTRAIFPGVALPEALAVTADLARRPRSATLLVVATPIAALAGVAGRLAAAGAARAARVAVEGLRRRAGTAPQASGSRIRRSRRAWPAPVGVVSGPSFAEEVARGLPTALVGRGDRRRRSRATLAARLRGATLRAYDSDDIAGVEVGGAIKNVLAIAAGASDGLALRPQRARRADHARPRRDRRGSPPRWAGEPRHADGAGGLGRPRADLHRRPVAQSPGRTRAGARRAAAAILAELGHVAEGVAAARAARALARHHGVDMPIADAVYRVLYEDLPARRAVEALLAREPKSESD